MMTLDYSSLLIKIIRAIKQVRISRCFFLLELLSEKDLFLKRLAERGGKREGGAGRENLGVISSKDINTPYLKCFTSSNKTSSNSVRFSYQLIAWP